MECICYSCAEVSIIQYINKSLDVFKEDYERWERMLDEINEEED